MNCNFYQIAYSIDTSEPSHPDFKIFNQIDNPYEDLRETQHMIDFFEAGFVKDDNKFYGLVSPKFIKKMKICFDTINNFINKSNDYDLIVLNSDPKWSYFYFNVWDQGDFFHEGLIETASLLNQNTKMIDFNARHNKKTSSYSNYWVRKYSFWAKYIKYLKDVDHLINKLSKEKNQLFFKKANNHFASIYPFVLERMLSNFLTAHKDINFTSLKYSRKAIINSATSLTDKILLLKYIDIIDTLDDTQDLGKISDLITQINSIRQTARNQNPLLRLISNVKFFFK